MTISSEVRKAGPFSGTGLVSTYPFAFKVFTPGDLLVIRTDSSGSDSTLALNSDYTVTLNPNQAAAPGGSIILSVALPAGFKLTATSKVAQLQPVDLTNQGGFFPSVINSALDRLTILVQQLSEKVSRTLRFPISDSGVATDLPSSAQRANKLLGFDSSGNPVALMPASGSATDVFIELAKSYGSALIGFKLNTTGSIVRTTYDKLSEIISVKDFGAIGDGVSDDTKSIQAAIDFAIYLSNGNFSLTSSGMRVFLPKGIYKTSDVIHLGYGAGGLTSIVFEGECMYSNNVAVKLSGIYPTFNDRPAVNVQGGRGCRVKNLAITGVNSAWLFSNYEQITDRSVIDHWYGPNITSANNSRYSPYSGITIDAYSGPSQTDHYPAVVYPSFLGTVQQYNKNYSSNTVFENVTVNGFVVGVMVQPGVVPPASQGDFVTFNNCDISGNVINYASGQEDARNPNFYNTRMHYSHTCIDGKTYGNQAGLIATNAIGCSFDNCFRLLNINIGGAQIQGGYPASFTGCYAEGIHSLGVAYTVGSVPPGISISDSKFTFTIKSNEFSPVYVLDAKNCDLYIKNSIFNGAYGFNNFNSNLTIDGLSIDKLQADVFSPGNGTANKVSKSYTCGVFSNRAYKVRINTREFYTFFGYNLPDSRIDSESLPIDLDANASAGTGLGFPIPWFVNNLMYGTCRYPVSNVNPLVLNRLVNQLMIISKSGNEITFSCNVEFITAATGSNSDIPFCIGKGDIVVDSQTGFVFSVISVSYSDPVITFTIRQLNYVKNNQGAWTAGGDLGTSIGILTFYNARRVYPSVFRVNFTAISGSNLIALKVCGDELPINFMTLPVQIDDYLISSKFSQSAVDSVFQKFTKVTAVNANDGNVTLNHNARRSFYGETPLFIKSL